MPNSVWFWQRIVSPHMAGLAAALADRGVETTYVAEQLLSKERAAQGWSSPDLGSARLVTAPDKAAIVRLAKDAPDDSVHICQGLRGNGFVALAQQLLAQRGMAQWVVMETVEDEGWKGVLRRLAYRHLVYRRRDQVNGYLAAGHTMPNWLIRRGARADQVFPFAYFLLADVVRSPPPFDLQKPFRFIYVGQLIERKNLELLIDALATIDPTSFELVVIGSGSSEHHLKTRARQRLGDNVIWQGSQPQSQVPDHMAAADCLVLPSRHDGWGAVVSEALMNGTPAICSDRCGVADVVRNSGAGGVFPSTDVAVLTALLRQSIEEGRQTPAKRAKLAKWSSCLGAEAGAEYLHNIMKLGEVINSRARVPWHV